MQGCGGDKYGRRGEVLKTMSGTYQQYINKSLDCELHDGRGNWFVPCCVPSAQTSTWPTRCAPGISAALNEWWWPWMG